MSAANLTDDDSPGPPITPEYMDPLDDVFGDADPIDPTIDPQSDTLPVTSSSSSNHTTTTTTRSSPRNTSSRPSTDDVSRDLAKLASTHSKSGYRDGITTGKAKHVQVGFDEGYALGAELGYVAGRILGRLRGISACAYADADADDYSVRATDSASGDVVDAGMHGSGGDGLDSSVDEANRGCCRRERCSTTGDEHTVVEALLEAAGRELAVTELFGERYFGPDGVWVYPVTERGRVRRLGGGGGRDWTEEDMAESADAVGGKTDMTETTITTDTTDSTDTADTTQTTASITFRHVARQHPLILKWSQVVDAISQELPPMSILSHENTQQSEPNRPSPHDPNMTQGSAEMSGGT